MDRPAPSAPSRFPVEALTLTAPWSRSSSAAIVARMASRWSPSRGRAAMIVRSTLDGRQPAAARRSTTVASSSRLSMPAGRLGLGRGKASEVAEACRAEERVGDACSATSPSEWPCSRARPSISIPPSAQRIARPEGMRVVADPGPASSRIGPARRRLDAGKIGGQRHLEIRGIAGDDMDRDSTGLQQGGLVGPRLGVRPAGSRPGARGADSGATPWGVWAVAERGSIDGPSTIAPSTTRLTVSATDTTGIAAPCARTARTTAVDQRPAMTSGRAPSWTRTARSGRRGPTASSAATPAATDSWRVRHRRRPATTAGGSQGAAAIARSRAPASVTTTIRRSTGRRRHQRGQRSRRSSGRPPTEPAACRAPVHPRRAAGRHDDRVGRSTDRRPRALSRVRGWAKIIRPATVWRTRVTDDVDVLVDVARTALDDDHRPVIEEPDALSGFLALLDDPDPQLLARQHGRLDRVGQRVDVHHPDALELGDPVEVEVVGQDRPGCGPGPAPRAWRRPRRSPGTSSSTISTGRPELLLHASEDLEAAPAPVAPQGVRGCRRCAGAPRARTAARPASRSMNPDSTISAIRPSMIALVSTTMCGSPRRAASGSLAPGRRTRPDGLGRERSGRPAWRPSARACRGPGRARRRAAATCRTAAGLRQREGRGAGPSAGRRSGR